MKACLGVFTDRKQVDSNWQEVQIENLLESRVFQEEETVANFILIVFESDLCLDFKSTLLV